MTTPHARPLQTQAPPEFDGPEGFWSPETLLVGAVADCFVLSFRAVARSSRLQWNELVVDVEGLLDRVGGVTRFTHLRLMPRLEIPDVDDTRKAEAALDKAHRVCLVTNSLSAESVLEPEVVAEAPAWPEL